ncbi:ATP-binding cassette domain-containing protein [Candidatus Haliotispira prima]|uniref:ATP-binding cassette domain-containing protein n=1 Tax=Candidatus Haliotispira prima TaxID=3034016 RepID=A0ABY8MIY6_9SPIO|nr:ATP-binding cassette domain-containing protein [Candidatus Haliotispira prima]
MITVSDMRLSFGQRVLFDQVNLKFSPGNCYGLIGANGAGKSTFLNILSGKQEADHGSIAMPGKERLTVLEQNHFAYDASTVLETTIMGHKHLYEVGKQRDELYSKPDFNEDDGMKVADLEVEFAELGGYEADNEAAILLNGLGIENELHDKCMRDLDPNVKVRVLLAQALFGNPDNLLLDEPTNHLDLESITWLENFLYNFENTVIVVSHDRHFLNQVCTHMVDIDFSKMTMFVGNYDFWQKTSEIINAQSRDQRKKNEDRATELKEFIRRFSANAAKSKQATSRRKELDKLDLSSLPASSRRFPYVAFKPAREVGRNVIEINGVHYTTPAGEKLFSNLDFRLENDDKIGFVGIDNQRKTALMQLISGEVPPDSGQISIGQTISIGYLPRNNSPYFSDNISMTDWLRRYSDNEDESYIRGFLGRMLFSGDESLKSVNVLSGGEKMRCMLAKLMLAETNMLVLDDPTAHLDLESITSLNNGLMEFKGVLLFSSHDHQFIETVANRIVEFTPNGIIDRRMKFDDYIQDRKITELRDEMFGGKHDRIVI